MSSFKLFQLIILSKFDEFIIEFNFNGVKFNQLMLENTSFKLNLINLSFSSISMASKIPNEIKLNQI